MNTIDPGTLEWVRAEIDETLKQARLALESGIEHPGDDAALRHCQTWLHQVVGTLRMVELDGPALLATETEALATALADALVPPDRDRLTVLTRGLVALTDYVGRLHAGQPDVPLRFLPVLNELRAAHGVEPIAELDLFAPDLSVRAPPSRGGGDGATPTQFVAEAARLRPLLQRALAEWLRAPDSPKPLAAIAEYLDDLRTRAYQPFIAQFYWVGAAFAETLASGALAPTPERRKLIGRIEQKTRSLMDGSERARAEAEFESLVRTMLYELAQAPRAGARAEEVKYAFGLDQLLTGSAAQEAIALPSPEALAAVSSALATEVASVQETLAAWIEDGAAQAPPAELVQRLERMSSTVTLLGVDPLRRLIDEIAASLNAIGAGKITTTDDPNDIAGMTIARAVLLIETTVRDFNLLGPEWLSQVDAAIGALHRLAAAETPGTVGVEVSDSALSEAEFRQLVSSVAQEVRVNLGRAEEFVESSASTRAASALADAAPFMAQVQGALQILGESDAALLAQGIRDRVTEAADGGAPSALLLDAMAFAIGTLGSFMDGLEAGRPNLDVLLDAAWRDIESSRSGSRVSDSDLSALSQAVADATRAWLADTGSRPRLGVLRACLRDLATLAMRRENDRLRRMAQEMGTLADMVATDAEKLSAEVRATLDASIEMLIELGAAAASRPAPVAAPTAATASGSSATPVAITVDPEIIAIFIEDAREILKTVARARPAWESQPTNNEALLELRRAFHTLKGSGRMVGARDIAEFGWAIENMLNRVRDGKIQSSPGMFALLRETAALLPGMVDALEAGEPANVTRAAELSARAEQFARGEDHDVAIGTSAAALTGMAPQPAVPAQESVASSSAMTRDPVLLEIFTTETRGHIATLEDMVARGRAAAGALLVEEEFTRAAHTLAGSARALEIGPMADTCGEMERVLLHHQHVQAALGEALITDVERVARAAGAFVDALRAGNVPAGVTDHLFDGLRESLAAHAAAEHARTAPRSSGLPGTDTHRSAPQMDTLPPGVDAELIEIFIEEAADILGSIDTAMTRLRADDSDRQALAELKRSLHTLKGGARMASLAGMGDLGHALESLLDGVEDGRVTDTGAVYDLVTEAHDTLGAAIEHIRAGEPWPTLRGLHARVEAMLRGESAVTDEEVEEIEITAPVSSSAVEPAAMPLAAASNDTPAPDPDDVVVPFKTPRAPEQELAADDDDEHDRRGDVVGLGEVDRRGQVRVRAGLLNNLVNYAGEVAIARSRMHQQIQGFRESLAELSRNVARFREQIRELEIHSENQIRARDEETLSQGGKDFDPLEFDRYSRLQQLSRGLAESLHDLYTIQSSLDNFAGEAETVLAQQARVNTELQEGLMRTRMLALATQGARLRHIVRQTARELGKSVEFELTGGDVEMDRTVLERMIGPFEHMIRNSVDHGIEMPAARARAGKNGPGRIELAARLEGTEIALRFSDDGRGLDLDAIRTRAIERGLIARDVQASDRDLMQLILLPGFSTAQSVTQLSGRGVGMDVVDTEVRNLGGRLTVESSAGQGTTFVIRLPLSLSITQALMAHAGNELFCIPILSVTNIVEAPMEQLSVQNISGGADGPPTFPHLGKTLPLLHLAKRMGTRPEPRNPHKAQVLIMKAAAQEFAVQVDGLGAAREVVVKPISPWMKRIPGVSAGTILGDGRVALILDAAGLWLGANHAANLAPAPVTTAAEPTQTRIMVVDDSITVRKVTSRFLEKHGLQVVTAKDGVEALELLREQLPDVMLVDIEMPRMDGYELTSAVRADANTKHIPIVMITSRAGGKHRERAFELGVNVYLSKPYQEDELLRNVNAMLRGEQLH